MISVIKIPLLLLKTCGRGILVMYAKLSNVIKSDAKGQKFNLTVLGARSDTRAGGIGTYWL